MIYELKVASGNVEVIVALDGISFTRNHDAESYVDLNGYEITLDEALNWEYNKAHLKQELKDRELHYKGIFKNLHEALSEVLESVEL